MRITRKITLIIILTIMTNISLLLILGKEIKQEKKKYIQETYSLGEISQVGYVGFEISYDNEPIDVELISPSGKSTPRDYYEKYDINTQNHIITAYKDTTELGEWKIRFHKGHNSLIKYRLISQPSTTIHLTNVRLLDIENEPYISFMPIMDDSVVNTCNYALSLKNKNHSFSLESGQTKLNETAYVKIEPDINAFNGEAYTLTISIVGQIPDQKETKDVDQVNILLPSKPKPIYRPLGIQKKPDDEGEETDE